MILELDGVAGGITLAEEMHGIFSPEGLLASSADFTFRAEQRELAVAVARSLEMRAPLCAEAGTGVGKSLAYLLPSIKFALEQKRKAIISTHTINLQEQLVRKDIPIARQLLGVDVTAVLLKGRGNYLCPLRLKRAMDQTHDLFTSSEDEELRAIKKWAEHTRDGTLSDMDFQVSPKVWAQVCSEPHICTTRNCGPGGKCFFQEARKAAADAQLVVVNHTLFFSLIGTTEMNLDPEAKTCGMLFPNDFTILDEAHTVEDVAAKQLGIRVSQAGLKFDLTRLFNPRTSKGLLKPYGKAGVMKAVERVLDEAEDFFYHIGEAAKFGEYGKEFRVRHPELVENTLAEPLRNLWSEIDELAADVEGENAKAELQDAGRRMREMHAAISSFLDQENENSVYWVERGGRDETQYTLQAAPIRVAEHLRRLLFREGQTCIMTSATLGVGDRDLKWFRERVGGERATALSIGSPFDYQKQMRVRIYKDMPEPSAKGYDIALAQAIQASVEVSKGRAFVLFTSYRAMKEAAATLENFFQQKGWRLLVQGTGMTRSKMLETFREDIRSVLFGTDSFWTGVDVPGESLTNVVVTRLPFSVPDHPLTQAKIEEIEANGGNPFMEFSVPEAVLKLRQGVGRLIRTATDCGYIHILDNRILTKRYGKNFLDALPNAPVREVYLNR